VRIEQGGASTITHLLALQGGVDLAADQWQLDLGVLNKGRCAELLAAGAALNAPDLGWSFPTGQDACGWEAGVRYPAQGRSGLALAPTATRRPITNKASRRGLVAVNIRDQRALRLMGSTTY
jgi:hypothetical protein